jgi:hypothetical protein
MMSRSGEPFICTSNQVGDPDGGLGFVVARAAAVEVAVALNELKWIHAPVFAFGFDNIGVREKQNWFVSSRAAVANDEIGLFRDGSANEDVSVRESCRFQASGRGFRNRSCGAGREAGLNFDELFVDVVRELLFGVGAGGLRLC